LVGWERKAVVHHPLTHAPSARAAAREAIAFLPHPHYSKGSTLQTLNGKKRVGVTTATRPPWGTVCPTVSSTQLGVAVSEKRRTRETVSPLVRGRNKEHHAHSLAMARVDTLQRLGESWISTSSIWLSPTLKPRSLERREQECATRSLMSARV